MFVHSNAMVAVSHFFSFFLSSLRRRYGVVDNRFCFEGGSRCGKGEGLYVFITDQGEEITHTFKLASQGKLFTKRRSGSKKLSGIESPRKQSSSPRPPADTGTMHDDNVSCSFHHGMYDSSDHSCMCASTNRISYWPSQESRDLDSNYGYGDTASVSENNDSFNVSYNFPR